MLPQSPAGLTIRFLHSPERPVCGNEFRVTYVGFWPVSDLWAPTGPRTCLHLRLLCHFESVINLDAEVANCTFQFGVPEQQLHGAEVLRATIDQGGFSAPECVRSVARPVQSQLIHPGIHDPGVLPRRQMG
jgi:hypothetical protein